MSSAGGFHEVEENGDLVQLVYHHPKFCPIPLTKTLTSSGEVSSHEHFPNPLFICPVSRWEKDNPQKKNIAFWLTSCPEYVSSTTNNEDHPVLPLLWCNNKEFDVDGTCGMCLDSSFRTNYYLCEIHGKFHKECVESPLKIKHPYHHEHYVQLYFDFDSSSSIHICLCCGRRAQHFLYYCTICQAFMHLVCAMQSISFVIDQPKRHDHPLTFFPRQIASLTCNVCGLATKVVPTYVCLRCNFVVHKYCIDSPYVIRISRHNHRISYISSLRSGEWSCGVCRKIIDNDYGAYNCDKCSDYAVHPRCALKKDVWDGEELEDVQEEDDITQDDGPFDIISDGYILHFLHEHYLKLEVSTLYEENKYCQACALPIFEGNFYSSIKSEFIIHESCAKSRRRIHHALHPHPLTLKSISGYGFSLLSCNVVIENVMALFISVQ